MKYMKVKLFCLKQLFGGSDLLPSWPSFGLLTGSPLATLCPYSLIILKRKFENHWIQLVLNSFECNWLCGRKSCSPSLPSEQPGQGFAQWQPRLNSPLVVSSSGLRWSESLAKVNIDCILSGNPRAWKYFSLPVRKDKYFRNSKYSH